MASSSSISPFKFLWLLPCGQAVFSWAIIPERLLKVLSSHSFSFPFPTPNQPCRDFKDRFNQDEKTQIKISHITCQSIGTIYVLLDCIPRLWLPASRSVKFRTINNSMYIYGMGVSSKIKRFQLCKQKSWANFQCL